MDCVDVDHKKDDIDAAAQVEPRGGETKKEMFDGNSWIMNGEVETPSDKAEKQLQQQHTITELQNFVFESDMQYNSHFTGIQQSKEMLHCAAQSFNQPTICNETR